MTRPVWIFRHRLEEVEAEARFLGRQIQEEELKEAKAKFNCPCVKLNHEIGIGNINEQIAACRVGLTIGWVAHTLSAHKKCPLCLGTGIPKQAPSASEAK